MGTGVERPSYAHGVPRRAFLVVPILALLVAGCGGGSGSAAQDGASPFRSRFEGADFGSPKQLADFALREQRGELVRLSSRRGKVVLVTFLYTECPDVCPVIADNLNLALRELGSDRESVRVLAVSLVGTREELEPVWKAYGVTAVARNPELVDHSSFTLLVDRQGLGRAVFDAAARPNAFVHDVRLLLAG